MSQPAARRQSAVSSIVDRVIDLEKRVAEMPTSHVMHTLQGGISIAEAVAKLVEDVATHGATLQAICTDLADIKEQLNIELPPPPKNTTTEKSIVRDATGALYLRKN